MTEESVQIYNTVYCCRWCVQTVREQAVRALVLVPTKELGQQVQTMIRQLTAFCGRDVRVADISGKVDISAQKSVLQQKKKNLIKKVKGIISTVYNDLK